MTDKELIRRALMGSREAQKECTEKGIVLPCPFCGSDSKVFADIDLFGVRCVDSTCIGHDMRAEYYFRDRAIEDWNTRPAQPVGKCKDCVWSREPTKEDYAEIGRDVLAYKDSLVCDFCEDARWKDDFCSYFKKRDDKSEEKR